ncbi:NAD(P)/FAD-dependent oxidoreductase [Corynebacterium mendelii]|uniref:NAD(P)/FAD-dependent oxidoreductase n=1 Tax=Corynebacterium mendelii TaxID=2765362 RepID=A0A939IXH6_9CORY|nr:NAD(P)/FAD-dependent oxidoreductase [Corynebacterium mendelii]MBN9644063.1 NAD(P)/FAD-dependent oxidoreductase [Corynebacterium mendelii]
MDHYDVVVVGGGPAGAMTATVLGRQQRDVLLVDAGEPRNKPATAMHMYLSRDGFPPSKLLELAREEISQYPKIKLQPGQVTTISGQQGDFHVTYSAEDGTHEVTAKVVVLATGQFDQLSDLKGLEERWGRGLFHCVYCYGYECTGRSIAVLSSRSGDAMLARYIADRFSDDVILLNQGYPIDDQLKEIVSSGGVDIIDKKVVEITGRAPHMVLHFDDGSTLEREVIFYRPDSRQHSDLADQLGCDQMPQWGTIAVNAMQQTSVPGVYAVGDVAVNRDLPAATGFVVTGASDGQRAAIWIEQELFLMTLSDELG